MPRTEKSIGDGDVFIVNLIYRKIFLNNRFFDTFIKYHNDLEIGEDVLLSKLDFIPKRKPMHQMSLCEIGKIGEKACYRFLLQNFQETKENYDYQIIHQNEFSESFKPYDISFAYKTNEKLFMK